VSDVNELMNSSIEIITLSVLAASDDPDDDENDEEDEEEAGQDDGCDGVITKPRSVDVELNVALVAVQIVGSDGDSRLTARG
jgi:hypothetical protein